MARDLAPVAMTAFADVNPPTHLGRLLPSTEVSFIPMQDVSEGGEWTGQQVRRFGEVKVGYTTFLEGDVLFAKITPCMENGKGTHARGLVNGVGFGSTEFHIRRARDDNYNRFIYHWSQAPALRLRAQAFMIGSAGQQRVQPDFFDNFLVPHLPPAEQVRVAAVLDTLDDAIRRTEQVIAKLQQMKQGLLHDLLTRGVDENGDLRPPPNEAPHLYKDSPWGLIPRAWGISSIGTLFDIESGEAPRGLRCEDGLFSLMGANGEIGRCRSANFGPGYIIGRVGAAGAITKVLNRVWASDNTLTAIPGPTTDFDLGYFLLLAARPSDLATKNAQPLITQSNLRSLSTVLIPEREQKALSTLLGHAEGRLRLEEDLVSKYRTIKHGLLNDLLTGRVRIPIPAEVPA